MRITEKYLKDLLELIAMRLNLAINKEQAIAKGLKEYLHIENNAVYGGYRVVNVQVVTGARHGAFGGNGCEARLKGKDMNLKLRSILEGIQSVTIDNIKETV